MPLVLGIKILMDRSVNSLRIDRHIILISNDIMYRLVTLSARRRGRLAGRCSSYRHESHSGKGRRIIVSVGMCDRM